jgi:hypothetical protein
MASASLTDVSDLRSRIDAFEPELFSTVHADLSPWDIPSLLGLHGAVAETWEPFAYLEIGSYRGGSLQVVIRDPRCDCAMSIDPRPDQTPDPRGVRVYRDNETSQMIEQLGRVESANLDKLTTFEASTETMTPDDLPRRPRFCFIDGEHTDQAVLRDGRFCAEAIDDRGVIAFHDYDLVRAGIRAFLKEVWARASYAVAFTGQVFAVELGNAGVLRRPIVDRAISSRWHSIAWRLANRPSRSAAPLLATWALMPPVDRAGLAVRRRVGRRG